VAAPDGVELVVMAEPREASKVRDEAQRSALSGLAAELGIDVAGVVPLDPEFQRAERIPRAPLDVAPDSPAIQAIRGLCAYAARSPSPRGTVASHEAAR